MLINYLHGPFHLIAGDMVSELSALAYTWSQIDAS